jgi:hypothetical protein
MQNPRPRRSPAKPSVVLAVVPQSDDYEGEGLRLTKEELGAACNTSRWPNNPAMLTLRKKLRTVYALLLKEENEFLRSITAGYVVRVGTMQNTIRETKKIRRIDGNTDM